MKTKCPFCNRDFIRNPRELLSNPFCDKCIDERLEASNNKRVKNASFVFEPKDSSGYGYFIPVKEEGKI